MAASVVADARNRTLRTLGQGLAVTVLSVIVNLLYEAITAAGDVTLVDWSDVSRTSATAVAMALIAFVQRAWLDSTWLPTAVPPEGE